MFQSTSPSRVAMTIRMDRTLHCAFQRRRSHQVPGLVPFQSPSLEVSPAATHEEQDSRASLSFIKDKHCAVAFHPALRDVPNVQMKYILRGGETTFLLKNGHLCSRGETLKDSEWKGVSGPKISPCLMSALAVALSPTGQVSILRNMKGQFGVRRAQ